MIVLLALFRPIDEEGAVKRNAAPHARRREQLGIALVLIGRLVRVLSNRWLEGLPVDGPQVFDADADDRQRGIARRRAPD